MKINDFLLGRSQKIKYRDLSPRDLDYIKRISYSDEKDFELLSRNRFSNIGENGFYLKNAEYTISPLGRKISNTKKPSEKFNLLKKNGLRERINQLKSKIEADEYNSRNELKLIRKNKIKEFRNELENLGLSRANRLIKFKIPQVKGIF